MFFGFWLIFFSVHKNEITTTTTTTFHLFFKLVNLHIQQGLKQRLPPLYVCIYTPYLLLNRWANLNEKCHKEQLFQHLFILSVNYFDISKQDVRFIIPLRMQGDNETNVLQTCKLLQTSSVCISFTYHFLCILPLS